MKLVFSVVLAAMAAPATAFATCPLAADYGTNPPTFLGAFPPVTTTVCANPTDSPCADHHVYVPSDLTSLRLPLLVFLPGTSMEPDKHDLVLQMAAYAGYRTLGLSYDNTNNVGSVCGGTLCTDDCHEKVRNEVITGVDHGPAVTVAADDGVVDRLYHLLVDLEADDLSDGVDDWGWGNYYFPLAAGATDPTVANIRGRRMIFAGFSQGGGNLTRISIEREVHGLVILEGANDECDDGTGTLQPATYYSYPDASAGRPKYGAAHRRGAATLTVPAPWITLGLSATDHDVDSVALPLTTTVASTDQVVPPGPRCSEHMSIARDDCMPTDAAAGISTTAPDAVHLFEPYLEMFCGACDSTICP